MGSSASKESPTNKYSVVESAIDTVCRNHHTPGSGGNLTTKKKNDSNTTLDPMCYKSEDDPFIGVVHDVDIGKVDKVEEDEDEADNDAEDDIDVYDYPFENVVFEGGGNKGLAYAGAVQEFERVGIWKNIRRYGGASAGAMWATLLALGYSSEEIQDILRMDLRKYFLDASCGTCSLLPNIIRWFGWHPAKKLFVWFGQKVCDVTGNPDCTFKQLYDLTGKELCIVVTNLSRMDTEYCHVKTTPNMPIIVAIRMTIAIPGLFGAVRRQRFDDYDVFVDGGVLCNYPIHCFDGWWLSMKPEDNMLSRLQPLEEIGRLWDKKERFGVFNDKTLGLMLYSSEEQDVMVSELLERDERCKQQRKPNTKLARDRSKVKQRQTLATKNHEQIVKAMSAFLRRLDDVNVENNAVISRAELEQAFTEDCDDFTADHMTELFGKQMTVSEIFNSLDRNHDNVISYSELIYFAEKRGVAIRTRFQGYSKRDIKNFSDFLVALQDTLLVNVKRIFLTKDDMERTCGIDTVYIDTTDFDLEEGDKNFLIEQGIRGARSYLRHYVKKNSPPRRGGDKAQAGPILTRRTNRTSLCQNKN